MWLAVDRDCEGWKVIDQNVSKIIKTLLNKDYIKMKV